MITRTFALSAIACFALSSATLAQTATETADESKPIAPIETDLNMGEDADVPQVGQTYIRENEQDWEIQCIRGEADAEAEEPCQMYQLLKDDEGNSVAEVSIFRLPAGGQAIAGATVVVPLETSLQAQLRISVDGAQGKRYPYSFCNPIGCFARIGLTKGDVDGFKRGASATVTIVPFLAPDQKVDLNMSLKGFTAGYDKSSVVTQ
ncbi:invasion associated locus B family protein [Planktotalea sp.]|uniref:invasion associated locus B family protein n=1 Tax=Planktotalea sp. TaxID=2029877 RepID=UPI003D6AE666